MCFKLAKDCKWEYFYSPCFCINDNRCFTPAICTYSEQKTCVSPCWCCHEYETIAPVKLDLPDEDNELIEFIYEKKYSTIEQSYSCCPFGLVEHPSKILDLTKPMDEIKQEFAEYQVQERREILEEKIHQMRGDGKNLTRMIEDFIPPNQQMV